jgi:hypothetical protein
MEDSKELLRIGDDQTPLVISMNRYRGVRYLDIRRYYFDKTTRTPKPSPKGIALREDEFSAIVKFLSSANTEIGGFFRSQLDATEGLARQKFLEKKARVSASRTGLGKAHKLSRWPALQFFAVDDTEATPVLNFNERIGFIADLVKEESSVLSALARILLAYHTAKTLLTSSASKNLDDFFDHLEIEWTKTLNAER